MMTSADVVDQLVPDVPEYWFSVPTFFNEYGHISQLSQCSKGVIGSVTSQIVMAISLTVTARVLINSPFLCRPVLNVLLVALGYLSLIVWVENVFIVKSALIGAISIALLIKFFSCKYSGYGVTAACLAYIVALEYKMDAKDFASSRGCLMILGMKLSALAFDVAESTPRQREGFDLLTMISYLISPATITFGPFITFETYWKSLSPKPWKVPLYDQFKAELRGVIRSALLLIISAACLLYSSCATELWFPRKGYGKDFSVAQSFRFSHYFVCFLAQGLSELSGLAPAAVQSVQPYVIEFPRSLVQVVVSWNLPMHRYLKIYIFDEAQRWGNAIALVVTFVVSSLYHGLNFQLSAVLLSLGFYCFVEHKLRNLLAWTLNACVLPRACGRCRHYNKSKSWKALLVNTVWFFLNMYHLVYLGMVFDGSAGETGYSYKHTVAAWKKHHYASHAIALLGLAITYIPIW